MGVAILTGVWCLKKCFFDCTWFNPVTVDCTGVDSSRGHAVLVCLILPVNGAECRSYEIFFHKQISLTFIYYLISKDKKMTVIVNKRIHRNSKKLITLYAVFLWIYFPISCMFAVGDKRNLENNYSHRAKAKVKISFWCFSLIFWFILLFFYPFRFRSRFCLVWIGPLNAFLLLCKRLCIVQLGIRLRICCKKWT